MLIGQDNSAALQPLELRHGSLGEAYGVRTPLGWTVNGPFYSTSHETQGVCNFVSSSMSLTRLENQVEQFWKLENTPSNDIGMSLNDKRALQIWDDTIHVSDRHYEIDIPFKSDEPNLPNNKAVAERRFAGLRRKLSKNEALQTRYKQEMDKLFERGHAEKTNDPVGTPGLTWYIPHHAVTNINRPYKLRVVYDCAAEYQRTSLNKKVLQGPDLMNKLIGVLLRFREGKYAMMADVEAMFYQVKVSPQHRDALRFL